MARGDRGAETPCLLVWTEQDQCTFLLGFQFRICHIALEDTEAAASSADVGLDMEMEVEMEVNWEVEMEMGMDPAAHAPRTGTCSLSIAHSEGGSPAARLGLGLELGWVVPTAGMRHLVPPSWQHNHHHHTALSTSLLWEGSDFLGPGSASLTQSPAGA